MDGSHLHKKIKQLEDSKRRKLLMKILMFIENGEFDSGQNPKMEIFTPGTPRENYMSPNDRDTYNSGYMEISEMTASSPNVE